MFNASTSPLTIHHRPRNKNTYITVSRDGNVHVRTPLRDEQRIRRMLNERTEWINKQLEKFAHSSESRFELGRTIVFRGEEISVDNFPKLKEKIENTSNIKKYYYDFYKNEAILTLPSRISHYSRKMGLTPSKIVYKRMKRLWGSCKSDGTVTFNTLMMQLSYEHIDYIIVHELAHLRHMNHSKAFHDLVRTVLSDEKIRRKKLRTVHPVF